MHSIILKGAVKGISKIVNGKKRSKGSVGRERHTLVLNMTIQFLKAVNQQSKVFQDSRKSSRGREFCQHFQPEFIV